MTYSKHEGPHACLFFEEGFCDCGDSSVENLHYNAPGTHVPRNIAGMSNQLSFLQLPVPTAEYKPGSHT